MFIRYDSMPLHFLLVSLMSCCGSHSGSGSQAACSMQAPGCPYGVPHHPGVCLTSAEGGPQERPAAPGSAARWRSGAPLPDMAHPSLLKRLKRLGAVGQELAPGLRIPLAHHRAALDLVIPPGGEAQRLGERGPVRAPAMRRGCDCARFCLRPSLRPLPLTVRGKTAGRLGER